MPCMYVQWISAQIHVVQVTADGFTCSIASSGLRDAVMDEQVAQFYDGKTQLLITTDIMARNTHRMPGVSTLQHTLTHSPDR